MPRYILGVILAQCAILGHFLSLLPKQHAREKGHGN